MHENFTRFGESNPQQEEEHSKRQLLSGVAGCGRTHHVGCGEGRPAGVGSGGTVGGGLAEVGLRGVALAVLLQVAGHVLARQARRYGAHVIQDLGRHCLVCAQRLHRAHKAIVELLRPLNLRGANAMTQRPPKFC